MERLLRVLSLGVGVEKKERKQSRRSKLVSAVLVFHLSLSLCLYYLALTFFLGTAIHRRCCCQSELWKGEAEAKSAEAEEEERVEDSLRRPPMISAVRISPANAAPIGISISSPPVLVEGGHSPLDVQGTESGC